MPPAADSNRAASLENTEREGEDREEGKEMGRGGGRGCGEQGTQHNNGIRPIPTMKKMQYQRIKGAC